MKNSVDANILTPIIVEKIVKRTKEMVIDLDDEEQGDMKRTKVTEEPASTVPGFSLHLGEEQNAPTSPGIMKLLMNRCL